MNTLSMPHDALFKLFLMDVDIAREFLQIHLPSSLQQQFDFNTLALAPGAFVEADLSQHYCDIVYSIRVLKGQGAAYILLEHESAVGKLTPFKLWRYQSAIMKQHLNQGDTLLPAVFPIIFYRGTTAYRGPLSLLDCFRDKPLAQEMFVLIKPIQLIDLSAIADNILMTHKRCAVLKLAQKYIHSLDLQQLAPKIFELFERYPLSIEKRKGLLYYLAKEGRGLDEHFVQSMISIAPNYQEDIMSAAQYLIEEGRQKGLQEGLQKGLQKGERQMALTIAENMLKSGAALNFIKQVTQLSDEKIATLKLKQLSH
ncbi:Rpn family recombination-promoting nuclease/putative transposase [Mycoavidus sp. HKI]|uniref:Rpn family recombination-promoting nuclease/putative transposase n=1 Tax=Mycoavidus sp. HKI TaxID=2840467 RepID=UPI001CBF6D6A|nr:Rpn family recombination-promoting nuclease/putative transposase [Mycoavidus sp. HKI]UAW64643.1 Rpn family recombination-promoting nuclease/putative transposase [Mycoavidus sp. HKI]